MKVLLIGSGGREHAIAWKLKRDDPALEIIAAPGNPGIAEVAECVRVSATDLPALLALARTRGVDLTIVGPEAPLELGIVDSFRHAGLAIFGPTRAAAEIETSKAFAKTLMLDAGIPTGRAEMHTEVAAAKAAARTFGAPVVVKASGLAAGKGVIVCQTLAEADDAIDDMLAGNRFGAAGHEVLVEEFMEGEEISIFAITDGERFVALPGLQDHKRLLDNDLGPNTGGMGAYLPVSLGLADRPASQEPAQEVMRAACDVIIAPTLRAMRDAGRPFTGLLYAGLMITRDGPRVIEFNCRFGDPETQALLPALAVPLLPLLLAAATGSTGSTSTSSETRTTPGARGSTVNGVLQTAVAELLSGACVTTVLAAQNYPDTPRTGDAITLPAPPADVIVFHAGTTRTADGRLVTAGGRVLAVSATAPTVAEAQRKSLAYADSVEFAGKQLRHDIGWREIARHQRA